MAFVELTRENFDSEVTEAEGLVLVDFFSVNCGPCRMLEVVLEEVAASHPDVKFASVNVSEHPDIALAFEAFSTPTLLLFKDGIPKDRIVGLVPAPRIEELLASV